MALALSSSQSGTATSSPSSYTSVSISMSSTSSVTAATCWPDADDTSFNDNPSGVPGLGSPSSHAMPYSASHSASSLYTAHHQSANISPGAHNSYAGYSTNSQEHTTSYHSATTASYSQSLSSQAQIQQTRMAGGLRHSAATSPPASSGSPSSSSLQYALRPHALSQTHAHNHANHPSLSAALASTTGNVSGGMRGHVSSPSPFSSGSPGSSASGPTSLASSLALSTLSPNGNSNSSVSPISPHPHSQAHYSHFHSQQNQNQSQQFQNSQTHSRNSTSYVHSHAYSAQGPGGSAGPGSGSYVVSGSSEPQAAYQHHHALSAGPNSNSSSSNINNNNNNTMTVGMAATNLDIHGPLYSFDDSPEPATRLESDFGRSPSSAHRGAYSHSSANSHPYPRLQIPTNTQSYGHGQAYTPVSPHPHAQNRASFGSGYAHAANGYGNDISDSVEGSGTYGRERSGTRSSADARGSGRHRPAHVKTEPDLEESRSLERSPGLSNGTTTTPRNNNEGGVSGSGGDGTGGARFVMEHPYPYTYATRTSQRAQEGRSVSPPSSPTVSMSSANGVGASYSSSPSTTLMSPERQQKDSQHQQHEQMQMQATPHTLTAPLRAINASAEMRKCMGVFRLDPFAQLNGVALRCGFVSSSFDEASGFSGSKKTGNSKKKKNKSKGKKGAKKRGRARNTKARKNTQVDSDDDDAMLSDITDDEDELDESLDDNTPTWDGLPAGPLVEEPVLIEFQLYFDGMEVEGGAEEDSFGVADGEDAQDMKVVDEKHTNWGRQEEGGQEDDVGYDYDYSHGPRRYSRSRAYCYSIATLSAPSADREKGTPSASSRDSRRYRGNEDAHRDRYNDSTEYTYDNNINNVQRGPEYEREGQDRKLGVDVAPSRIYYHPTHSQAQERAAVSSAMQVPRAMTASASRGALGMLEEYLDLGLGGMESMDDINMSVNGGAATTSNDMDDWASGVTSPTTPHDPTGGRSDSFSSAISAQVRGSIVRPATFTSATATNHAGSSSSADSGANSNSTSLSHPNANSFQSASVSSSSPAAPSSYANEHAQTRARYIDSAGYMRLVEPTQLPPSSTPSSSSFLSVSGQSTPSTTTSVTGNTKGTIPVPSSSPSPLYGLASGTGAATATGASSADTTVNLQQLRTQAALRAVSAHTAQAHQSQSQALHGLYRVSSSANTAAIAPEAASGSALSHVNAHRLVGAAASSNAGISSSVGASFVNRGADSGVRGLGQGQGFAALLPTPASLAADMQTGLLASGRSAGHGTSAAPLKPAHTCSPRQSGGQGQYVGGASAYNASVYPPAQSHAISSSYGRGTPSASNSTPSSSVASSGYATAPYADYGTGFSGSGSSSGTFGQSHTHNDAYTHTHSNSNAHNHVHGHGGNRDVQNVQSALERRWSDVLQRVHG